MRGIKTRIRSDDPGKHVQGWITTSLWKRLRDRAEADGVSLGRAVFEALELWVDRI